jgi:creatinine amidohydrolase
MPPPSRAWADRTATDVAEAARLDPVVILPMAAIEQHGPHLPLSTDVEIGSGLLRAALARLDPSFPAYHLPMQAVGTSDEHADVPGTLTLDPHTVVEGIVALGHSIARAGVRRLVVCNSHGGNRPAIDVAALRLRRELGLLVVKAHWFRFPRPDEDGVPASEWEHGLHGGAVETAMMLHLRPGLVRSERIRPFLSLGERLGPELEFVRPEGVAPFAWMARDLNPDGVVGDATLADPGLGARLVDHYAGILAQVIRDARAFPLDRLAGPSA